MSVTALITVIFGTVLVGVSIYAIKSSDADVHIWWPEVLARVVLAIMCIWAISYIFNSIGGYF